MEHLMCILPLHGECFPEADLHVLHAGSRQHEEPQQGEGDRDPGGRSRLPIALERWHTQREDGRQEDVEAGDEAHFGSRRGGNAPFTEMSGRKELG